MLLIFGLVVFTYIVGSLSLVADYPIQYLSLCLAVRDEPLDIHEWIEYHRFMGVSKIYVMDHGSKHPLVNVLVIFSKNLNYTSF